VLCGSHIQSIIVLIFDNEHFLGLFGMPQMFVPLIERNLMRHIIYRAVKEQTLLFINLFYSFLLPYSQDWLLYTWNHDLIKSLVGILLDLMDTIDLKLILFGLRTKNRPAFTINTVNYSILIDFGLSRHQQHIHPFFRRFAY
jgi:hypothetical protein